MTLQKFAKKLVGDEEERAVSPVIGVILMVAITVILAAVIAAFVLDLGDTSEPAQASLDISESAEDNVEFTVQNADRVDEIVIRADCIDGEVNNNNLEGELSLTDDDMLGQDDTGETIELEVGDSGYIAGDEHELVDDSGTDNFQTDSDGNEGCGGEELTFVAIYEGNEEIIHQYDYEGE